MIKKMPSEEKPWLKYYKEGVNERPLPPKTIYQLLESETFANKRQNFTAMRYFNFTISFNQFIMRINDFAKSLKEMGIRKGDMVVLLLPNIPECRELIYAVNITGATVYPINPMLPVNEFERILDKNCVSTVFMFEDFYPKFGDAVLKSSYAKNLITLNGRESIPYVVNRFLKLKGLIRGDYSPVIKSPKYLDWKEFSKLKKHQGYVVPHYEKDSIAAVVGTSGTTGVPKGVCLTNENMNAMALQHLWGDIGIEPGEKLLDALMQSIGYGIATAHYCGVLGLETVLVPKIETHVLPYISKYDIMHFTGGPVHYETLKKDMEKAGITKLPKAKNMVSGGATLMKETEAQLNHIDESHPEVVQEDDIYIRQGLGSTENGGAVTYAKKGAYKFRGVGIPLVLETVGIFKPGTDEELYYDEVGEICVTGPTVMKGYLNNPEETEKVLRVHRDGKVWLHMGDLGYIDKDGQIFMTDRIKNIFMRLGFNIHPSKIEEFINSIPLVEKCYVTGVQHDEEQMVPIAFVKLDDPNMNLEQAQSIILGECYQNLDELAIPYTFIFVDDLPLNLGGKVDSEFLLAKSNIDVNTEKPKTMHFVPISKMKRD